MTTKFKVGVILEELVTWTVEAGDKREALQLVKEGGFGRPAGKVGPVAREWLVQDMSDKTDQNLHFMLGGGGDSGARDTGLVTVDGSPIIIRDKEDA